MDRYWFHRLLKGSVNHAIAIEKKYQNQLPELSLSDQIGKESFFAPTGFIWLAAKIFVRHERFRKSGLLHSDGKLELFYKAMIAVLVVTSILLAALGGVSIRSKAVPELPAVKSQAPDPKTNLTERKAAPKADSEAQAKLPQSPASKPNSQPSELKPSTKGIEGQQGIRGASSK